MIQEIKNADGSITIIHPTGVQQTIPKYEVIRMKREVKIEKVIRIALHNFLMNEPDCGKTCGLNYKFCGCYDCAANKGFFEYNEQGDFTELQQAQLASNFDPIKGYLRENGCILPREIRSINCMRNICRLDTNVKKYDI